MSDALLEVEDFRIRMPGRGSPRVIVDGVGFEVAPGEVLGIAGESGSGKTMTVLGLLGLQPPTAVVTGRVVFDGQDLLVMRRKELRRVRGRKVGVIFQDPMTTLHPMLSVERQLTEHMRLHLGLRGAAARSKAIDLLEEVRIPNARRALDSHPHQFSGGMRQRLVLAMALACEPKLLIADEPTTALDVTVQAGILRLLDRISRDRGMAMILVTHDLGVMSSIADRVAVFYAGRVVEVGPTRELLQSPQHPYTRNLLLALPDPQRQDRPLRSIPGSPATPENRPAGCPFHPRCEYAEAECRISEPALEWVGTNRQAACPVAPFAHATSVVIERIGDHDG